MKFSDFKSVEDVLAKYPLHEKKASFIPQVEMTPSELFMDNLKFTLSMQASVESEMFYREAFVFPFMQEAWKRHPKLKLWVNRKLAYQDELTGEPDYFVSVLPQGPTRDPVGKPLVAVAEAKQEDFIAGWGQCLAEMIACQKLNGEEKLTIYGIVSTGEIWQFGKLEEDVFTKDLYPYSINDAAKVLGVLDYLFEQCEKQITGGFHEI
jgi:hypothetical protein